MWVAVNAFSCKDTHMHEHTCTHKHTHTLTIKKCCIVPGLIDQAQQIKLDQYCNRHWNQQHLEFTRINKKNVLFEKEKKFLLKVKLYFSENNISSGHNPIANKTIANS